MNGMKNKSTTPTKKLSQTRPSNNDSKGSHEFQEDLIGVDLYDLISPEFQAQNVLPVHAQNVLPVQALNVLPVQAQNVPRVQAQNVQTVQRPPISRSTSNVKAGKILMDFGNQHDMAIVTLGQDGKYTLIGATVDPKTWRSMSRFQMASVYRLREDLFARTQGFVEDQCPWANAALSKLAHDHRQYHLRENMPSIGGAGAQEFVEDRRPSQAPSSAPPSQLQHSTRTNDEPHASRRQPRTRTNNKPPASQTQPRTRVDIVELPEPRPLAPLAMGGMTQAQIDTMMATLQTQSEVLKRTQEQQAASNAQIMHMQSSMAFLADTMKKFQDNGNNEHSDEEKDYSEDGELFNMESCD